MKYTKGTYSSSAKGHSSNVNLTVNFDSDKIKNVSINVEGETSQRNKDVVSQLSAQILKAYRRRHSVPSRKRRTDGGSFKQEKDIDH